MACAHRRPIIIDHRDAGIAEGAFQQASGQGVQPCERGAAAGTGGEQIGLVIRGDLRVRGVDCQHGEDGICLTRINGNGRTQTVRDDRAPRRCPYTPNCHGNAQKEPRSGNACIGCCRCHLIAIDRGAVQVEFNVAF